MEIINTDVFQLIIDFESSKLYSLNEVNDNLVQGKIFYLELGDYAYAFAYSFSDEEWDWLLSFRAKASAWVYMNDELQHH